MEVIMFLMKFFLILGQFMSLKFRTKLEYTKQQTLNHNLVWTVKFI